MLEFAHDTAALVTFDRKADRPTCGRLPVNGACYPVTVPGSMKQQTARRASKSHHWFSSGIAAMAESWRDGIYEENGDFSGTLDVSTFWSSFLAFFTAFFSFFACFRSPFVILDIRCRPPLTDTAAWTFGHRSQVNLSSLRIVQVADIHGSRASNVGRTATLPTPLEGRRNQAVLLSARRVLSRATRAGEANEICLKQRVRPHVCLEYHCRRHETQNSAGR